MEKPNEEESLNEVNSNILIGATATIFDNWAKFSISGYDIKEREIPKLPVYEKNEDEKRKIYSTMSTLPYLDRLNEDIKKRICDSMEPKTVACGDFITQQNTLNKFFYVIMSGQYEEFTEDGNKRCLLRVFNDKGVIGEHSLYRELDAFGTIRANTDGMLFRIEGRTINIIIIHDAIAEKKRFLLFIENFETLKNISPRDKNDLFAAMSPHNYDAGDYIYREEEMADNIFRIEKGLVSLLRSNDQHVDGVERVADRGPTEFIGDMQDGKYICSAFVSIKCTVIGLNLKQYKKIFGYELKLPQKT